MADLLEIGSSLDWISPVAGWIGDVINGPSHTFLIPVGCGYSGNEIARMLRRRGVRSWGRMVVDGTIMVSVRKSQENWARLHRALERVCKHVCNRFRFGAAVGAVAHPLALGTCKARCPHLHANL